MSVIDASVWIALFKKGDMFHEQAKRIIQPLLSNREKMSIPAIAFVEVAGSVKRTMKNADDAREAVLSMKDMELEVFVDFSKLEPLATEIAINHSIKGADACYLAVPEITRSNLYTFDKQQQEAFDAIHKTW
jgi:predicted nucleic acid-binding protein